MDFSERVPDATSHIATMAEFVAGLTETSPQAREAAAHCVLDLTTAAVAGLATEGGQAARRAAPTIWGAGASHCWFGGPALTVAGATYANAAIACALDLDDGHRLAAGHPGAAVIPAVLAEIDAHPTSAARALDAIAIGYEIGVRIGGARDFATLDTTATGRWCGQGVAAAIGWLRGLPAPQLAHALGLAACVAPNMNVTGYRTEAGHLKEGIPWAAATGVAAAGLAAAGQTGTLLALEDTRFFQADTVTDGLGDAWLIETTYFKPYSVCRWAHAALDALDMLIADGLPRAAIDRMDVFTFSRALSLSNEARPRTSEGAQYSIPYCLALLALRGRESLQPLDAAALADTEASDLAEHIALHVDPAFDAMFSAKVPARLVVHAALGIWEKTVEDPLGEPTNPMDWAALVAKLHAVTAPLLDKAARNRLVDAVTSFRNGDLAPLQQALRTPARAILAA